MLQPQRYLRLVLVSAFPSCCQEAIKGQYITHSSDSMCPVWLGTYQGSFLNHVVWNVWENAHVDLQQTGNPQAEMGHLEK